MVTMEMKQHVRVALEDTLEESSLGIDTDIVLCGAAGENGVRLQPPSGGLVSGVGVGECVVGGGRGGVSNGSNSILVERDGSGGLVMSYRTPTGGVRYLRPTFATGCAGDGGSAGDKGETALLTGFTGVPEFCLNLGRWLPT